MACESRRTGWGKSEVGPVLHPTELPHKTASVEPYHTPGFALPTWGWRDLCFYYIVPQKPYTKFVVHSLALINLAIYKMTSIQNTELQARLAAEQELNIEMLPGTEILSDISNLHRVHAHNTPDSTVLVPQPSASPDDPLVWKPKVPTSA